MTFNPNQRFHIPELGINGDYLHTFQELTEITWKLSDNTTQECHQFTTTLQFPPQYAGCQIHGGDRITETNLLLPEHYIRLIKEKTATRDVFVLTDDYRLFEQVRTLAPGIRWYILYGPNEQGYIDSAFTQTTKELKQRQMAHFLCSIQLSMDASVFIGSIITGPGLFLLKKFYPKINPTDCLLKNFPRASVLPIPGRGRVATEFIQESLKLQ